jgi:hypothetical protein
MPDWILGPLCAALLLGFIFYAFRQGMKTSPDRTSNGGQTENDYPDSSWGGSGHGGSDSGGHPF